MCFHANTIDTAELRNRIVASPRGWIVAYKVVTRAGLSPTWWRPEGRLTYEAGKIVQAVGRRRPPAVVSRSRNMGRGIYVYRRLNTARRHARRRVSHLTILRVRVRARDLIGADAYSACFWRVEVVGPVDSA